MAQPAYETSPSSSYRFKRSIVEYATQTPAKSSKINPLHSGPHSMNGREKNIKHRMSRLEMMKIDYQQKLLKEKEDKLTKYHVASRDKEPQKTNSGGTVREFFAERRALEAQQNPSSLPPIQAHFNKVKGQRNQANPLPRHRGISQQEALSENTTNSNYGIQRRQSNQQTVPNHQQQSKPAPAETMKANGKSGAVRRFDSHRNIYQRQKRTKGIDKQDPLPPLHKGSRKNSDKPPTPNKRYETYADLTGKGKESDEGHRYMPTPPRESKPVAKRPRAPLRPASVDASEDENISVCTDDAPPNLRRLKAKAQLQKQLSLQQMNMNKQQGKAELSDFQKWQMEQDQAREERLDRFKNKTPVKNPSNTKHEDGDKSSDLAKRERELLEKIEHEQARLARLQNERQKLEEQEQQEAQAEEEWARKLSTEATNNEEAATPEPVVVATKKKTVKQKQKKSKIHIDEGMKEDTPAEIDEQPDESYTLNFYAEAAVQAEQVQVKDVSPCSVCGRTFASDRLARHEKVCAKNSKTKRKTFNSTMQRAQGTEYEKYITSGQYKEEPEKKAKKVDWRAQHENFIKTIRYAKGVSEEPPPPTENPEYVQCPHCKRKFNPYTAERHIPKCKDIKARPAPFKKR